MFKIQWTVNGKTGFVASEKRDRIYKTEKAAQKAADKFAAACDYSVKYIVIKF